MGVKGEEVVLVTVWGRECVSSCKDFPNLPMACILPPKNFPLLNSITLTLGFCSGWEGSLLDPWDLI